MLCKFIVLAAVITAQPLVDEDVLEPSVLNEVDHALGRAPTNTLAAAERAVAFREMYATNGMNATQRAISLVSSQRSDGRWFFMGQDVTKEAVRLLLDAAGYPDPTLMERPIFDIISDDNFETVKPLDKERQIR